ncbi:hypothetical protein A6F58_00545 [Prescottella equi]|nr:hypothetical protein A6F58_00545 [Prescottella equi]
MNRIPTIVALVDATGIDRKTWSTAMKGRRPTPTILDALARLGARPDRILIVDEANDRATA